MLMRSQNIVSPFQQQLVTVIAIHLQTENF